MIICSCNVISDHDIRNVVGSASARPFSTAQVYDCLGCTVQCGQCSRSVKQILEESPVGFATAPAELKPREPSRRSGALGNTGDFVLESRHQSLRIPEQSPAA